MNKVYQRWPLHAALFALTFVTTTVCGGLFVLGDLRLNVFSVLVDGTLSWEFLRTGMSFSVPLMLILSCHEMGHYIACRHHSLAATLPLFLPVPFGIGTFGAVIRIMQPIRNKRQLLDVGAAGPLAGFLVSLPFLGYGIYHSSIIQIPVTESTYVLEVFGEPLIFKLFSLVFSPKVGFSSAINLHPCGWAAWFGLFVTLLNLLPFAQLDGGHVTYALFPRAHRAAAWPLLGVLVSMGFFAWIWWIWVVLVVILGIVHPRIWDERLPLNRARVVVGWSVILVFVLCFMPIPIGIVQW